MSATPNLRARNASETESRPVLRPAGNTTILARKILSPVSKPVFSKVAPPSPKDNCPKLSTPLPPSFPEQKFSEIPQSTTCDGQCEHEERSSPDDRIVEARRNLASKRSSVGGKMIPGKGNAIAKSPSIGIFRSPNIAAAKSPWSSIGSSSSEEHLIISNGGSEVKRETRGVDVRRKVAGHGRKQPSPKFERVVPDVLLPTLVPVLEVKKRCGWITSQSDPTYIAYHDMEWGVPVHDDRKLFELLVLVGAQSELTWPVILSKREICRAAFAGFDPAVVAKFDNKKIASLKAESSIFQQESKIRGIIENATRVLEIKEEFGSFDNYLWGFVNHKPMLSKYRYPKQVPVKTPKSELISKDLLKRGFRFVGPTVMYSFMQAMGMSNDHLVTCFRYKECSSDKAQELQAATEKCTTQQIDEESFNEDEEVFSVAALYAD